LLGNTDRELKEKEEEEEGGLAVKFLYPSKIEMEAKLASSSDWSDGSLT